MRFYFGRIHCSFIPKPVWAVGFALEQTLRDATLTVFRYVDFKVALAYIYCPKRS
ncbi:MAG: hypothetical protein LBH59_06470 [Planctomycetaceae bacterium]|nr:hypothetical protein [Planctomycetaceae bacterium]